MRLEIHVHIHNLDEGSESLALLEKVYCGLKEGKFVMAESPEVAAFRERMDAATNNIAADIQRLLDKPSSTLSDEDKAVLEGVVTKLEETAAKVPE